MDLKDQLQTVICHVFQMQTNCVVADGQILYMQHNAYKVILIKKSLSARPNLSELLFQNKNFV